MNFFVRLLAVAGVTAGVMCPCPAVAGRVTFTASDATDNKGKLRKILGYTVQAWEGSDWGAAEEHAGTSYEHVVGTSPAKVLLTWQWQSAGTMLLFR